MDNEDDFEGMIHRDLFRGMSKEEIIDTYKALLRLPKNKEYHKKKIDYAIRNIDRIIGERRGKPRMKGGMPVRDSEGSIKSQYFGKKNDNTLDYEKMANYNPNEIPDLLDLDTELSPEEKINHLFTDISDLSKIYNDSIDNIDVFHGDNFGKTFNNIYIIADIETLKNKLNSLTHNNNKYENLNTMIDNLTDKMQNGERINKINYSDDNTRNERKLIKLFNVNLKNTEPILINDTEEIIRRKNPPTFFEDMEDVSVEKLREYNNLKNKAEKSRNSMRDHYNFEDFKKINPNIDDETTMATLRGNVSEDFLTINNNILKVVDEDNSMFKNSKDINAYSRDFKVWMRENLIEDGINNLLKYIPIDGIKENTIWELKSYALDNNNIPFTNYTNTKFSSSIFTTGNYNYEFKFLYNVQNPTRDIDGNIHPIDMDEYDKTIHGDIINVSNINVTIKNKNNNEDIVDFKILKPNDSGYKYFLLESTKNGFRSIEPLKNFEKHTKIDVKKPKYIPKLNDEKKKMYDNEGNIIYDKILYDDIEYQMNPKSVRTFPRTYEWQNSNPTFKDFIKERQKI
jgi:hypothetical protein